MHSIIISHPPDFFARGCHYDYFLHHSIFSSLKMEAEKLAQEKTEIQRQYIMVCCSVLPFLLHVAYLFILRLCLHYDLEVA